MKTLIYLLFIFTIVVSGETQIDFVPENGRIEIYWTFEKWDNKNDGFNLYRSNGKKSIKVNKILIAPGKSFEKIKQFNEIEDIVDIWFDFKIQISLSFAHIKSKRYLYPL